MNQLTSLFKTLESMKLHVRSEIPSINDIKLLIATDHKSLAAHHIRKHIHYHMTFNKIPESSHQIQILNLIHNIVIDEAIEHEKEYFDSLFELIRENKDLSPILKYHEFKEHGYKLDDPDHYDKFVKMGKTLNNKDFKNKELFIFFCAKILETHDNIKKLKSQYI